MNIKIADANQTQLNDLVSLLTPASHNISLLEWAIKNREKIEKQLLIKPALLLRGFPQTSQDSFSKFCNLFDSLLDYKYRSTPRTSLGHGIYTATEYPPEETIPQHCENAYQNSWPLYLFFYCAQIPTTGGETPLADVKKISENIPESIKEKFRKKNVMYVRNYRQGLDIPWQTVFQTNQKQYVEEFCHANAIQFSWTADVLQTRQICQGLATHPITQEELWFNQAHLFHYTNLEPGVREMLMDMLGETGLPRNARYGDGEPIKESDLEIIRDTFKKHTYTFTWQQGDILFIDNMRCSHGRAPFTGPRKVFVAMSRLIHKDNLIIN